MRLSDLDKIARRQHGVVARDQTTMRAAAWQRAIAAGTLVEVHRGVARLVGTADTPQQSIAAAVLAVGDGALASHRSAALLHGIPVDDAPPVDIVVPHRRCRRSRHHVRGRTVDALAGRDASIVLATSNAPSRTASTRSRAPTP